MAAIVDIREWNGPARSPTKTSKSSSTVRFKASDSSRVDALDPLVKPASGQQARSYEKWLRLCIGAVGPLGVLSSPRFYTNGASFGTGVTLYVRTLNPGAYIPPQTPHDDSAGLNAFAYVSAAPKALDTIEAGPYRGVFEDIADFLVLWMTLGDTVPTPQNPATPESISFAWDET